MQLNNKHIVCGRGQRNYNNEGNRICRRVVERRLAQYMDEATGRGAKTRLVDATTRKLFRMNMVFVTRTSDDSDWVRLSKGKARTKVAHLFRDASRQARRYSDWNSNSTNAGVMPSASDSDESWSLSSIFSTDDESDIYGHSDMEFNDDAAPSRTTILDSDFNHKVALIASIDAIDARSGDNSPSQQQHVLNVVTAPDSLGLHGSLTMKYLDAMESALDKLLIHSSTNNLSERNHIMHELERIFADSPSAVFLGDHEDDKFGRRLLMDEDNDAWSLSGVEHVDHLCALIVDGCDNDFDN
ncbi:hypothetical protein MHU86_14011 [Fragilaria crotonensis]|nr:hypothetical protein MHU86_14011 [Fragilaria crotonensis]